jgi:translation initiation factor 2 beta subunit (eIF-2beta)/eIF-5
MDEPEYLVCINCETPCYTFVWKDGSVVEATCMTCGDDEPDEFVTEEEFEAMTGG